MRTVTNPVLIVNLADCKNIGYVKDIIGYAWQAGFSGASTGRTGRYPQDLHFIVLPGITISSKELRKDLKLMALMHQSNRSPMLIENDGSIWQTTAEGASSIIGELAIGDQGDTIFHIATKNGYKSDYIADSTEEGYYHD